MPIARGGGGAPEATHPLGTVVLIHQQRHNEDAAREVQHTQDAERNEEPQHSVSRERTTMHDRIAQRLTTLQAAQAQTQAALAHLEQQRQGLLQQLIGQQYAAEVLQELLKEPEAEAVNAPTDCAALHGDGPWRPVAP